MEQNATPWTAIGLTRDGLTITTGRGDPELEATARALVRTPLTFEYANGAGPVPMSPLPVDSSLIQVPNSTEFGGCHLMPGLYGTLVADDRWVLALRPGSGQPWAGEVIKVYWPDQWTARRDNDRLVLLDAMREVVAAVGDPLVIGGGRQYADGYLACNVARGESARSSHQGARHRAAA